MIKSEIKFNLIKDRLDSTFYKPEFLYIESLLRNKPNTVRIGDIAVKVKDGPGGWNVSKRDYTLDKGGIPFLGVSDIKKGFVDLNDVTKIFPAKHRELKASALKPGDVLLSVRGTTGFSAVVPDNLTECNISAALVLIRLKSGYDPTYVSLFLSSKFGVAQTQRLSYKAVQADINLSEIRSVQIFIPTQSFQQKIERMVKEAHQKRKEAEEKYKKAQESLEGELGLEKLDLSTEKTFETKYSDVEDRFNPDFYQPKFEKINFTNLGIITKTIKEICSNIINGQYFDVYISKGIPYIRVTDITSGEILIDDMVYVHPQIVNKTKLARKGDIITARVGSIGFSTVIPKSLDRCAISDNLIKLTLRDKKIINPYYLVFYLNSRIGKATMSKLARGGVQQRLNQSTLENLEVPILPIPVQKRISEYMLDWFRLYNESKVLIHQAKKEVEKMIERGEKNE